MKEIPLTQGKVMLVDDADYEWLSQWNWCASKTRSGRFYAVRKAAKKSVLAHRQIMVAEKGSLVDHKDGDGLNCQRYNLRLCRNSDNLCNRGKTALNKSGLKGVCRPTGKNFFVANIKRGNEKLYLGTFPTAREAALAYDEAALRLHGEFARTNATEGNLK